MTIDEAWLKLLEPMNTRVTAEELAKRNQTSIALPKGGGYLAWLEVFHELHCIVGHQLHTTSFCSAH